SVRTACACAKVNRTPETASASMFGVRASPPANPSASARNVSIVITRTFRSADGAISWDDCRPLLHDVTIAAIAANPPTSKRLENLRRTGELSVKTLDPHPRTFYALARETSRFVRI